MQVEVHSRHFSLSDDQRDMIIEKLENLERFSPRTPVSAKMTLTREGGRFTADLAFYLKSNDFRAKVEGVEPELVADEAIENIKTQLRRFKGRITGRPKGEQPGLGQALGDEHEGQMDVEIATLKAEGFRLQDLTVEDAVRAFAGAERPFLVFRNSATDQVNVVYQREGGEYGLLEPTDE